MDNGTRLHRLIIDKGTEAMRRVFDSIHSPATLTTTLWRHHASFQRLPFINRHQMNILFPPIPLVPSKSEDYDITLLIILLRNICGLNPPVSTGSWDTLPPPADHSQEADLARIKYYKNVIYSHITTTAVNDVDFTSYWDDISVALIRRGVNVDEIKDLETGPLHEENVRFLERLEDKRKEREDQINLLFKESRMSSWTVIAMGTVLIAVLTVLIAVLTVLIVMFYNSSKDQASFALDFSSHLNISNSDFVGREWFFQELEHAVNNSRSQSTGVIILGDPGSGKSAIMLQLISSPSSTPFIHKNVIGYYVCKFDEIRTRDGMRFVHTLVQQLARNIPEYFDIIQEPAIQNELKPIHCKDDPIGCFVATILNPIKELKRQENTTKFILIDALDECIWKDGKSSAVVTILKNKMTGFPAWIKLIISSRNKTALIAKLPTFEKLAIDSTDQRNLEDIRLYVQHVMLGNDSFKTEADKEYVKSWISKHLNIVNGVNFLYVKTLLLHGVYNQSQNYFPPTLDSLYGSSFRDRFKKKDLKSFTPLFEVLLALNSPPTMTNLEAVLKIRKDTYDIRRVVKKISEYLIDSDGTVRFYHQSFANWLMKQTEDSDDLFIQISRGHQYIVDYLFDYFHKRNTTLTLQELFKLSMHVLLGEMEKRQVRKIQGLNVSEIRDPQSGECILHKLARERNSIPIIQIFLKKFDSIDIFTKFGRFTPLCYAASSGKFENLKFFIDNGADVNNVYNSNYFVILAEKGYTKTAELLINNGVDFDKESNYGERPLWRAARNGHLDFVKLLVNEGVKLDVTALRRAAERNHSDIVRFLLDRGIRDVCNLECKSADRCLFPTALHAAVSSGSLNIVKLLLSYGKDTLECKNSLGQTPLLLAAQRDHSDIVRFLLDMGIRDVCLKCKPGDRCLFPTALHTAVFRGHLNIVKLLLSHGKDTLECKDRSGRTPLLLAAKRNNTEIATLLLNNGANMEAKSSELEFLYEEHRYLSRINSYAETNNNDKLNGYSACGTRSIHIFARYGSWEMVKELVFRWNANLFSEDCLGLTPVSLAIMQDRVDIVRNFNDKYAGKIATFIIKKENLYYTAVCGSPETLSIANGIASSSIFQTVYNDGMTLLHLAANWSAYPATRTRRLDYWEMQSCTEVKYADTWNVNKNHFSLQKNVNRYKNEYKKHLMTVRLLTKLQTINKTDKYGRTALHYAAARGFAGAVRHFVRQGSDWRIKDQDGDTPLELALKESPPRPRYFLPCRMTSDGVFQSCNSTMFDETVRYLIMVQKSTIKKCNTDTKRLLYTLVKKNMPLSLYNLFKIGVDVNCGVALKMQLNISKLRNDEISEVFKIFEVDVNVECDVPFNRSELHLMAYLGRPNNIASFFKPSVNNRSFPLQRFIDSHPNGFRVLDECRDKEGYLAIHRAAQGGNFDAVSWFISLGVDIFKKTRSGWNALHLSIYSFVSWRHLEWPDYIDYKVQKLRKPTLEKLLEQFSKTFKYKDLASSSWCKPEFTALSPLHIAAFGGIKWLNYVSSKTRLSISCTNKHGIEPRYLAYLYEMPTITYTSTLLDPPAAYKGRYPEREAEYHLIYNLFFQTPELDLSFELDFEGLFKCPGLNEFLPEKREIEGQTEQCNDHCLESTSQVIRNFLSAFPYMVIKNYASFVTFGERFIYTVPLMSELRYHTAKMFHKIPSRFWRQVSEAYSCSQRCRCVEIMRLLQKQFTSRRKDYNLVGEFVAERMGWKYTSDVLYRWPFRFLLKKALKRDKDYEYLKIIGKD